MNPNEYGGPYTNHSLVIGLGLITSGLSSESWSGRELIVVWSQVGHGLITRLDHGLVKVIFYHSLEHIWVFLHSLSDSPIFT